MADQTRNAKLQITAEDDGSLAAIRAKIAALRGEVTSLTGGYVTEADKLQSLIVKKDQANQAYDREVAAIKAVTASRGQNEAVLDKAVTATLKTSSATSSLVSSAEREVLAVNAATEAEVKREIALMVEQERLIANTAALIAKEEVEARLTEFLILNSEAQAQANQLAAMDVAMTNEQSAASAEQIRLIMSEAIARNEANAIQRAEGMARAASTSAVRNQVDAVYASQIATAKNTAEENTALAARTRAIASLNAYDAAMANLIKVKMSDTATSAEVAAAENAVAVSAAKADIAITLQAEAFAVAGKSATGFAEKLVIVEAGNMMGARGLSVMSLGLGTMAGATMPVIIGLTAVAAAMASAISNSMSWEHELVLLINNTTASDEVIGDLSRTILDFGAAVGGSSEDMAKAARIMLDFGFTAEESIMMMVETSKLAIATGADQADVAQAIGQAMHQYGAEANQVSSYLETLYAASLRSNSTMATFAGESKRATGIASELGISYNEVTAAISALTRVYGTVAEAQTQVLGIMRYLASPTKEEAAAWDDLARRTGDYNLAADQLLTTLGNEGLTGLLSRVNQAFDTLGLTHEQIIAKTYDLVNAQRGGQGLLLLLTEAAKDYKDTLSATADPQEALNRVMQTSQNHWERLGNQWVKMTSEGGAFNDVMKGVADTLNVVLQVLGSLVIGFEVLARVAYYVAQVTGDALTLNQESFQKHNQELMADLQSLHDQAADLWKGTALAEGPPTDGVQNFGKAVAYVHQEVDTATGKIERFITVVGGASDEERKAALDAANLAEKMNSLSGASAMALDEIQKGFKGLGEAIASGGPEAGVKFAEDMITKLAELPPQVQATLSSLFPVLQQIVADLQQYGGDAGFGFTYNLNEGLTVNYDPIRSLLGKYDSEFDKRALYRTLGIQTGDNFGQNVKDRIEAWWVPIKSLLMTYLAGIQTVANALRNTANAMATQSPTMAPGMGATIIGLENTAIAIEDNVAAQKKLLDGLKSEVDAAGAAAIAEHELNAARKGSTGTDSGQLALNAQRRENALNTAIATMQEVMAEARLRDERQAVADATQKLTDITKDYDNTIKELTGNQASFDAVFEESIHGIDEALYSLNNELKTMKAITDRALEPYKKDLDDAKKKVDDLRSSTQAMDEWFDQMAHNYVGEQNAIADADRARADALRDIADEERTAMAGMNAIIEQDQANIDREQAKLTAITEKYEKLIGLKQDELDLLVAKDNQQKRDQELQDMAQSVGNLQARIADAIPGSREYNALMKERDRTAGDLNRKQKEFKLEDQIKALKDAEKIAQGAAQASIKAAQEQLKADQAHQKEMQAEFDRRRELIRAEQELADKRKETIDKELEGIARAKEAYDYAQHQKEIQAEADAKRSQKAYDDQKTLGDAAVKSVQDEINKREDLKKFLEREESEADRRFQKQIGQITFLKGEAVAAQQAIVDGLAAIFKTDQEANDAQSFANKYSKAIDTLTTAIIAYGAPIGTAADKTKIYAENTDGVNKANAVLIDALNNQVTPAVQGYADKTLPAVVAAQATWMKYFGPTDKGGDSDKSVEWYLNNRNPQGFYAKITTGADLGLGVDGFRGMVNNRMDDMDKDLIGKLNATATAAGTAASGIGTGILGGITTALGNEEKNNALAQALIDNLKRDLGIAEGYFGGGSQPPGSPITDDEGYKPPEKKKGTVPTEVPIEPRQRGSTTSSDYTGTVTTGDIHVTMSFPNVRDHAQLPRTREELRGTGLAVNQEIAYDLARRGIRKGPG